MESCVRLCPINKHVKETKNCLKSQKTNTFTVLGKVHYYLQIHTTHFISPLVIPASSQIISQVQLNAEVDWKYLMIAGSGNKRKSSTSRTKVSFKRCLCSEAGGCDRLPTEVKFTPNINSYSAELITTLFSLSWASLLSIIHSSWHVPFPAEGWIILTVTKQQPNIVELTV